MKKQYLLIGGSITAVVLIVFASFTSVVGHISVNDSEIVDSPLFKIRSNEVNSIEYTIKHKSVKVNNQSSIPTPGRDNQKILMQNLLKLLRKMDAKTFDAFIAQLHLSIKTQKTIPTETIPLLINKNQHIKTINQTSGHPRFMPLQKSNEDPPTWMCVTVDLECWLIVIILILATIIALPIIFLYNIIHSILSNLFPISLRYDLM